MSWWPFRQIYNEESNVTHYAVGLNLQHKSPEEILSEMVESIKLYTAQYPNEIIADQKYARSLSNNIREEWDDGGSETLKNLHKLKKSGYIESYSDDQIANRIILIIKEVVNDLKDDSNY